MNDAKSVDLVIACLFEDHCVNDGFPSFERVSGAYAKIDDGEDRSTDKGLFVAEGGLTRRFWLFGVWRWFNEEGFVVAKVPAGRRRGCGFLPCLDLPFEFFV
jgi:hypothetical protein